MTERMVLMAETPTAPPRTAASEGSLMFVMFGVIFAQTGIRETSVTQLVTSSVRSGCSPISEPMRRPVIPCGQENFNWNASAPVACTTRAAPPGFDRLRDDARVRPRRARAEQERIWELDAVDCDREIHKLQPPSGLRFVGLRNADDELRGLRRPSARSLIAPVLYQPPVQV